MRRASRIGCAVIAAFAALAFVGEAHGVAEKVTFTHDTEQGSVKVYIRGEHFTTYHYGSQHDRTPFLWPVNAEGGVGVTRNYPMGTDDPSITDHPHHRSLFIAAVVNGHDFFHQRRGERIVTDEVTTGHTADYGYIRAHNRWLDRSGTVLTEDTTELRFHDTPASGRIIDLIKTFHATHGAVSFRRSDKYAFLAVRIRPEIAGKANGIISNAHGDEGERSVFGKPSPWIDYAGVIEGHGRRGIAIFDHPDNIQRPFVFARDYGLMMFNPFGNPGADPIRLAENETLTLQYRAYVHAGDEPDIAGQYRRYAN